MTNSVDSFHVLIGYLWYFFVKSVFKTIHQMLSSYFIYILKFLKVPYVIWIQVHFQK